MGSPRHQAGGGGAIVKSEISGKAGLPTRARGREWRGKTGSICHFRFSLVLQCLGVSRYPYAGKNSTENVIVTPLFLCPKC